MPANRLGQRVIDAHAHFITFRIMKKWFENQQDLEQMQRRVAFQTDMKSLQLPSEPWDVGRAWVDELDSHGITAIGMMVDPDAWDEFNEARRRFPGRFLGYLNVDPKREDAPDLVKRAARDGFHAIKLYPSSWEFPAYDDRVYPIYEEALRNNLLVILHFGITIGNQADLRYANPLDIQRAAHDFPDLNFMIAHFGAGFFREVLLLMYQTHNVVMDTSGSNMWMNYMPYDLNIERVFERALKAGASCRIVFGTDSSFFPRGFRHNILKEQLDAVKSLQDRGICNQDDIDLIFAGNILRLTGFRPSM